MSQPRRIAYLRVAVTILVFVVLLFTLAAPVHAFPDVPAGHPYEKAINDLSSMGVIGGYSNGSFGLNDTVKRAQFAKMIVGALGIQPVSSTTTRFTDLGNPDANGYPHKYVQAAYDSGITYGTNSAQTQFSPWNTIRRDQVVSMIVRGVQSIYPGQLLDPPPGYASLFANVGEPHGSNLRIAEYNGLLDGLVGMGSTWQVTANATRGEVAQMLWNLIPYGVWVYADGTGDYPTIEAAVAAIGPRTVIHLGTGNFHLSRTLVVDFPFQIVGSGTSPDSRTNVAYSGTVLDIESTGFMAQDVVFVNVSETRGCNTVDVIDSRVDFEDCWFLGAHRDGSGTGYGLYLRGTSVATVTGCALGVNDYGDIAAIGDTQVMIEDNQCVSHQMGISLWGNATGTIRGNKCNESEYSGIQLSGNASATIENNDCSDGGEDADGIVISDEATGTVRGNTCSNNGLHGIFVQGGANVTIENNVCSGDGFGIGLYDSAVATVRGNTCKSNYASGISLHDAVEATLENNTCSENTECGIAVFNNATATVRDNTCNSNGALGIVVRDDASALVEGNTCISNVTIGIGFGGRSTGIVRNNECSGSQVGIGVVATAAPDIGSNNLHANTVNLQRD